MSFLGQGFNFGSIGGTGGPTLIGGNDAYTEYLSHFDGGGFLDSSSTPLGPTGFNGAAESTTQKKFGSHSLLLANTNDFVAYADDAGFFFGNGDFAIDMWVRPTSAPPEGVAWGLVTQYSVASNNRAWGTWWRTTSGAQYISFFCCANTDGTSNQSFVIAISDLTLDTWVHVAWTRHGADLRLFLDGVQQGATQNITTNIVDSQANFHIGNRDTENSFQGYVDEVRISKGVPRHTSNFTPPTQAYDTG